MSIDLESLLHESAGRAPAPGCEAELRAAARAREITAGRSRGRPRVGLTVAAACVVGAIAAGGGAWLGTRGEGQTPQAAPRTASVPQTSDFGDLGSPVRPVGTNPFAQGGRRIALADASRVAGFHVYLPSGAGITANVSDVWFSDVGGNEVILDYEATGIRISEQRVSDCCAPWVATRAGLERMSTGLPGTRVLTVHGVPALLAPPDASARGFLQLSISGLEVAIMSSRPGTTSADLIAIGQSLE